MSVVSEDERLLIVEALREGKSQTAVAKEFGRSPSTVNRLSKETGVVYSAPKRANAARRSYAKAARLDLSDRMFGKLRMMVDECDEPRRFKELAVVYGILTDKRLLEEGEATNRIEEKVTGSGARQRLAGLLSSFDERGEPGGDS